jgi:hypothetical protein
LQRRPQTVTGSEVSIGVFSTDSCSSSTYNLYACAQRLLAKDVLVCLDGLDSLLGMNSRNSCHYDSLELRMLEHLIKIVVELHSEWSKMLIEPRDFRFGLGGAICGHQLCSRSFCATNQLVHISWRCVYVFLLSRKCRACLAPIRPSPAHATLSF